MYLEHRVQFRENSSKHMQDFKCSHWYMNDLKLYDYVYLRRPILKP